jgi:dihydroorotate dehydrogenase
MFDLYSYIKKIVFLIPPENAHKLAIQSIKYNHIFDYRISDYMKPYLSQDLFGLKFDSPVGLAAGFDKNCELYDSIHKCGFGFAECGTVTPKAQEGNPKPRVFRIPENEALINCLGFNNEGIEKFLQNAIFAKEKKIPIGINIGPNKNSEDFFEDYEILLEKIFEQSSLFDYITINISSPNTKCLRDLHNHDLLLTLLERIALKKEGLLSDSSIKQKELPIFLKISPDIQDEKNYLEEFLEIVLKFKDIKALIISNTTIEKDSLAEKYKNLSGGLSGRPLFEKSTNLLKKIYSILKDDDIKLVGIGGISSSEDAYMKIKCGASLIGFYTAMIYHGPFFANEINRGLVKLLQQDGFSNISEAIGIEAE